MCSKYFTVCTVCSEIIETPFSFDVIKILQMNGHVIDHGTVFIFSAVNHFEKFYFAVQICEISFIPLQLPEPTLHT